MKLSLSFCVVWVVVVWGCVGEGRGVEAQSDTRINLRYVENGRVVYEFPPPGRAPGPEDGYYPNAPAASAPATSAPATSAPVSHRVPSNYRVDFFAEIN